MATKGLEYGKPIIYDKPPSKIKVEYKGICSVCDNCGGYGLDQKTYTIKYSDTDFARPSGFIGKNRYAKKKELWLCEDCLKELFEAIKECLENGK